MNRYSIAIGLVASLLFSATASFSFAQNPRYYRVPLESGHESYKWKSGEKAEIDVAGSALIVDLNEPDLRYYLAWRNGGDIDRKEVFGDRRTERTGWSVLVRTESTSDFTVTFRGVKLPVASDTVLRGDDAEAAENCYILCQCLYYANFTTNDAPGLPILLMMHYHFDDLLCERLRSNGVETSRREGFRRTSEIWRNNPADPAHQEFDFFSGITAIRSNLDFTSLPKLSGLNNRTVSIGSIRGISVAEVDWKNLLGDAPKPVLDPLAGYVPEDQHFVVFPDVKAALSVLDAVEKSGLTALATPIPTMNIAALGVDPMLVAKYKQRLGLTDDVIEQLRKSSDIKSIAVTGSDIWFRDGTDVAILFETSNPAAILRIFHDKKDGATVEQIDDKTVLVTNSPLQVKRIQEVKKSGKSLASLDEFCYFRTRYQVGDPDETVFVYMSDATIRRWCSPKWRIGQARRLEQRNSLIDVTTDNLHEILNYEFRQVSLFHEDIVVDHKYRDEAEYQLTAEGAVNSIYGSYKFLTPIAELRIDKVSKAEKKSYEEWRDAFEASWRGVFDPIGIRLTLGENVVKTDMTILPLNQQALSTIGSLLPAIEGAKLEPNTAWHDVPLQLITALNKEYFQSFESENSGLPSLSWIGEYATLIFDDGTFWSNTMKEYEKLGEEALSPDQLKPDMIPVVLEVGLSSREKAIWSIGYFVGRPIYEKKYAGVTYYGFSFDNTGFPTDTLFAAITDKTLLVSLNEDSLKRAMQRQSAASQKKPEGLWLGESFCMKLDERAISVLDLFLKASRDEAVRHGQSRVTEILDIYKRRGYSETRPIETHERIFGERIMLPEEISCPSPFASVKSIEFGITLENGGLRARGEVRWGK